MRTRETFSRTHHQPGQARRGHDRGLGAQAQGAAQLFKTQSCGQNAVIVFRLNKRFYLVLLFKFLMSSFCDYF